jgi:hypothetical protein
MQTLAVMCLGVCEAKIRKPHCRLPPELRERFSVGNREAAKLPRLHSHDLIPGMEDITVLFRCRITDFNGEMCLMAATLSAM